MKVIDCHSDVILCMTFNTDGSLLATSSKDRRLRLIDPRSGDVLQVGDRDAIHTCCHCACSKGVQALGSVKGLETILLFWRYINEVELKIEYHKKANT